MPRRRGSLPLFLSFFLSASRGAVKSALRTCGNSQHAAGRKSDADAECRGSEEEMRQKRAKNKSEREREKERGAIQGVADRSFVRESRKVTLIAKSTGITGLSRLDGIRDINETDQFENQFD